MKKQRTYGSYIVSVIAGLVFCVSFAEAQDARDANIELVPFPCGNASLILICKHGVGDRAECGEDSTTVACVDGDWGGNLTYDIFSCGGSVRLGTFSCEAEALSNACLCMKKIEME